MIAGFIYLFIVNLFLTLIWNFTFSPIFNLPSVNPLQMIGMFLFYNFLTNSTKIYYIKNNEVKK